MFDETGKKLAALNGSNDPATYWNEHYNQALGKALAEFMALTGMTYDSPHSQNFLVELDKDGKPTGKIVLRDFGDTYLSKEYFSAIGRPELPRLWEKDNVIKQFLPVTVGILHGNQAPSWIDVSYSEAYYRFANVMGTVNNKNYDQWGRDFHAAFKREFKRQTGVNMQASAIEREHDSKYVKRRYYFNTPPGLEFLDLAKKGLARDYLMIRSCTRVFALAN
jgi:hypothetical protein